MLTLQRTIYSEKDLKSPRLHYKWHSQIKLIFIKQNKEHNYKTKIY